MKPGTLSHNGYTGTFEIDTERNVLYGEVLGIRDVVTFEGTTVEEATRAFRDSVDDYLEFCAETGEPPNKPYSGRFNVRLPSDLHRDLDILARVGDQSINHIVTEALRREVRRLRRQQDTPTA